MINRRKFIQYAAAAGAAVALPAVSSTSSAQEYKTRPHKAIIGSVPTQEQMAQWLAWCSLNKYCYNDE